MSSGFYPHDYPNARYIAVEVDLATGCHQLLNVQPASHSECISYCQARGSIKAGKTRQLLLSHKDAGE